MKKIISILTCSSLLLTSFTAFAKADVVALEEVVSEAPVTTTSEKSNNEPTSEKLEAVIKKVRPLVEVPESYKDFSWNFNAGSY